MSDEIKRRIFGLLRRVQLSIAKVTLSGVSNSDKRQILQVEVMDDEKYSDIDRYEDYGMTSYPPSGSDGVGVCIGGGREGLVVIKMDHTDHRPNDLVEGEMCIYTDEGKQLYCKRGGVIQIGEDGTLTEINGGSDFVALSQKVDTALDEIKTIFNNHSHIYTGAGTGSSIQTTPPLAVTIGDLDSTAAEKLRAT